MVIVGIDPGAKHTGIAIIQYNRLVLSQTLEVTDYALEIYPRLLEILNTFFPVNYIVIEDYHGGTGGKDQTDTARVIGTVEAWYWLRARNSETKLIKQRNIARAPFQVHARELVRTRFEHPTQHQYDACAHALSILPKGTIVI